MVKGADKKLNTSKEALSSLEKKRAQLNKEEKEAVQNNDENRIRAVNKKLARNDIQITRQKAHLTWARVNKKHGLSVLAYNEAALAALVGELYYEEAKIARIYYLKHQEELEKNQDKNKKVKMVNLNKYKRYMDSQVKSRDSKKIKKMKMNVELRNATMDLNKSGYKGAK